MAVAKTIEFDQDSIHNPDISLFDLIARPEKPIEEFSRRELGNDGEHLAAAHLARRGYAILELNWRCRFGEVDIVAQEHEDEVVLVEVKTRLDLNDEKGPVPELNVTAKKQEKYKKLALMYLALHPYVQTVRFDVIAITLVAQRSARLRHLISSFVIDQ